ncbi:sugar phosphate isomerase/epimerase family protein, partial [Planctomycetota bacterium]
MDRRDEASTTRRGFLRLGAVGAAAGIAGCLPKPEETVPIAVGPKEQAKPAAKWTVELGLQSYSLRGFSFDQAIAKAQEVGLHYMEFFPNHFPQNMKPEELAAAKLKLAQRQIAPNAYGVCGVDKNEGRVRPLFDFCKRAGIGTLVAAPSMDSFGLLDKLVAEYDITIAIHNHGPGDNHWGKLKQLVDGTKDHHPHIGVCLDTGHLVRSGDDPIDAVVKLGPRLHGLHFKDVAKDSTHDCICGQGRIDLVAFFAACKAAAFDGPCSLEYE